MLKTWEGIKLLVNTNKRNKKSVTCLIVGGIEETDPFLQGSDKPGKPGKPGENSFFLKSQGKPGKLMEF